MWYCGRRFFHYLTSHLGIIWESQHSSTFQTSFLRSYGYKQWHPASQNDCTFIFSKFFSGTALSHHISFYFLRLTGWALIHHDWLLMITLTTTNTLYFLVYLDPEKHGVKKDVNTTAHGKMFTVEIQKLPWKLNNGSTWPVWNLMLVKPWNVYKSVRFSGAECEPTRLNVLFIVNREDFKILPLEILWA